MKTDRDLPVISVSPAEAAKSFGVSRDHIYRLIEARLIESGKSGSRVLVDWQSLLDYFESIRRMA